MLCNGTSGTESTVNIDASGTDSNATPIPGDSSSVFDLDFNSFNPNDFLYQATFAGLTITGGDAERGGGINLVAE